MLKASRRLAVHEKARR